MTSDQVAAVLAHERAHARERHDLVLLPFIALRRLFPRARLVRQAVDAVALLVETRADEQACRQHGSDSLVGALRRFGAGAANPPAGALGVADATVAARLLRLHGDNAPLPALIRWCAVLAGSVLAATPLSFLFW